MHSHLIRTAELIGDSVYRGDQASPGRKYHPHLEPLQSPVPSPQGPHGPLARQPPLEAKTPLLPVPRRGEVGVRDMHPAWAREPGHARHHSEDQPLSVLDRKGIF